jgi:hypothetical protein
MTCFGCATNLYPTGNALLLASSETGAASVQPATPYSHADPRRAGARDTGIDDRSAPVVTPISGPVPGGIAVANWSLVPTGGDRR